LRPVSMAVSEYISEYRTYFCTTDGGLAKDNSHNTLAH
jgi:hypothetical protein